MTLDAVRRKKPPAEMSLDRFASRQRVSNKDEECYPDPDESGTRVDSDLLYENSIDREDSRQDQVMRIRDNAHRLPRSFNYYCKPE